MYNQFMFFHHPDRRRARQKSQASPAVTSAMMHILDRTIYVVGIIGPLFTIPQLVKIYYFQNASGVSAISWGAYTLLDLPWILYGVVHKERPITLTYILWFFFNGAVFVGALLYSNAPF